MVCLKCGNENNFVLFKGETVYIRNARISHAEKSAVRAMCTECFSCDILLEEAERYLEKAA